VPYRRKKFTFAVSSSDEFLWRNFNKVGPTMAPNTAGVNWNQRFSTKISLYLGIGTTCHGHYSYNGRL